ncbi:UDP-glucose 4-epimerase GalE [Actinomycetospora endophytica]|uniref:UDP-glucose 4-epimerase n=1 Tax=Actinomycetospora endophytica TaxID=2291215 RepID=A0ABS8PD35_9PSEU|nr:UDP-glucose 4-epimerase GalE [Actinomycetospora endophytica]MCD2196195.1 UDP-glucose 4-epimerase GalE [Actinomycetospora endophytica]
MTATRTVLVTGGAGFIGSHTCVDLLEQGYDVVTVDDHSNSSPVALDRVQKIAGRPVIAYTVDLRDRAALDAVFAAHPVDAVIHFGAKKAVNESTEIPLEYFDVNVGGTSALLRTMHAHEVHDLVFSSSCSIYGETTRVPLTEDDPARPTNPYAHSKWMGEQMLADTCRLLPELRVAALRYFNPLGAHPSGELGEDPSGVPNNLLPYVAQVAVGRRERLRVFGDDYPTPDGTAVRDYIHVLDVARAHRLALDRLLGGMQVLNLGTGVGSSVLDVIAAFEAASGRPVPYDVHGRRPGDVAVLVADPTRAHSALGWRAERDLAAMCVDAWRFQYANPAGYGG